MKQLVITTLLLVLFCPVWAQPFSVGSTSMTFSDPDRGNRNIPTNIYYPATSTGNGAPLASGEFPIVAFGHGFAMPPTVYSFVWNTLVPKGYIVCLPDTETSIIPPPSHPDFGIDLAFIAAKFINDPPAMFSGSVKPATALMGHSMGGGCSMLGAENNPTITTTVTFAAADTNPSSVSAAANVTAPSLFIAGEVDCVTPDNPLEHFNNSGATYRVYTEIANGTHCKFADNNFTCNLGELGCPNSISRATQHAQTMAIACAWLDYYLLDDCNAWPAFQATLNEPQYQATQNAGTEPLEEPLIEADGDDLVVVVGGSYTYQWYIDDVLVPGATASTITPTINGSYTVEIENSKGCTALSVPFLVSVLPVSWLYVRAVLDKRKTVGVAWGTISEENADYFEVQRSADGVYFRSLGQVEARGTTNETQHYYFRDMRPLSGWSYYRLRQFDLNGSSSYSNIAAMNMAEVAGVELQVWPNPWSGDQLNIEVSESLLFDHVTLMDASGKVVWQQRVPIASTQKIEVPNMPVGWYTLSLFQGQRLVSSTSLLRSEQ